MSERTICEFHDKHGGFWAWDPWKLAVRWITSIGGGVVIGAPNTWVFGSLYFTDREIRFRGKEESSNLAGWGNKPSNKSFEIKLLDLKSINLVSIPFSSISSQMMIKLASTETFTIQIPNPEYFMSKHSPTIISKAEEIKFQNKCLLAEEREKALDYDEAIAIYENLGKPEEAKRVRKLKAEQGAVKVDQTVVHGDYVDDRDTIVKDSVVNKSNIGAGGKSKSEELRDAKALLDDGIIDEDEFKQMKKEILGK